MRFLNTLSYGQNLTYIYIELDRAVKKIYIELDRNGLIVVTWEYTIKSQLCAGKILNL
jgi:hypothetical protein